MARLSRLNLPRFFLWLLPLSFLLQVAAIGVLHQYRIRPGNDNFEFGWEMGRVARSIAQGHGFSSPYDGNTGPTAWEPPLYPYLMAGVFELFGMYSRGSAWVLLSINSLLATLTCIPIFLIARRTFGESIARWSAFAWALNPYVWYWSIHWLWDTTFTPLILACAFWVALELSSVVPDAFVRGGRVGSVRSAVRNRRACQPDDAAVPSLLRTVDLAPAVSSRTAVPSAASCSPRSFSSQCSRRG